METKWVDFKTIKQTITITQVLHHYGITLKASGSELRGRCPIHQGDGTQSFHASIDKNAFHCFSCGAKGNVLDFVAAMEKCSVGEAALKIQSWFQISATEPSSTAAQSLPTDSQPAKEEAGESGERNKPLSFRLKGIDHHHAYLESRGIDRKTAERCGAGFYSGKGTMHGRIVIPVENENGELVAYAGRSIDGSEPKYKLPAGFKKSQVLYNLARVKEDSTGVVVLVEGFFDCMKVTEAGYPCVALMGCSMSQQQEQLLIRQFRKVMVMLDGDEPGLNAAIEIASRLVPKMWVHVVNVPEGNQPDQLSLEALQLLLGNE